MTAPSIPRGLKPVVSGYTSGAPEGVVQTEVEGGAPRSGLAFDRGLQPFNVTLPPMSGVLMQVWTIFFLHSIKKGSISFQMLLDSGTGEQTHLVTMVAGSYQTMRLGGGYTVVSFQVRAEPQAFQWTAAEVQTLLDLYEEFGGEYGELLSRLAQFSNVDTLVLDF